jgi:uncharacterized membrane protein YfhO
MLVAVFAVVTLGVFSQFLFGSKLLLFLDIGSDTYYSYYPAYYLLANYVSHLHLPMWSFKVGAGASVMSLYQFLYDPFTLVFYLGGVDKLSRLVAWVYVLKVACAGTFTWAWLRYLGVGPAGRCVGALLFAFSGFLMGFGQHFFYAGWLVFLPLYLLTIELWFRGNRWLPLLLCTAYMALNIPICWQVGVFCILYVLGKLVLDWRERSRAEWARKLAATAGIVGLGLALSAALWMPEYYVLKSSPRMGASVSTAFHDTLSGFFRLYEPAYYRTLFARLFSNNLEGVGSDYAGYVNYYESLQPYVGMLPLLLIPQMFVALAPRTRWIAIAALLAAAWFMLTPGFAQLMNGFQYPLQRWGYNIVMFEILLAAVVLHRLLERRALSLPVLGLSLLALFACLGLLHVQVAHLAAKLQAHADRRLLQTGVILLLYTALLWWLVRGRHRALALGLLLATLGGELVLEHHESFTHRTRAQKGMESDRTVNYFDYGSQAAKDLAARDTGLYRLDKNHWLLSLSDSLVQDYNGVDAYQSLNSPGYIEFLNAMGIPNRPTVVMWNSLQYPVLADLLSVKYHLTKVASPLPEGARLVERAGDVSVYERTGTLPFGFTYEARVPLEAFVPLDAEGRAHALLQGALVDPAYPVPLREAADIGEGGSAESLKQALRREVLHVERMDDDRITGTISLAQPKLLFLSIPYDKGWSARVDGQRQRLLRVNVGFSGLYLPPGRHRIELNYRPPMLALGAIVSGCALLLLLVLARISRVAKSDAPAPGSSGRSAATARS